MEKENEQILKIQGDALLNDISTQDYQLRRQKQQFKQAMDTETEKNKQTAAKLSQIEEHLGKKQKVLDEQKQELAKKQQDLGELEKNLVRKQERLRQEMKEMEKFQVQEKVILNVGGKIHETTKATLTQQPESFFGVMLSGRHDIKLDKRGHIFIDRDGEFFTIILNGLRSGVIRLPDGSGQQMYDNIEAELEFYMLQLDIIQAPQPPKQKVMDPVPQIKQPPPPTEKRPTTLSNVWKCHSCGFPKNYDSRQNCYKCAAVRRHPVLYG